MPHLHGGLEHPSANVVAPPGLVEASGQPARRIDVTRSNGPAVVKCWAAMRSHWCRSSQANNRPLPERATAAGLAVMATWHDAGRHDREAPPLSAELEPGCCASCCCYVQNHVRFGNRLTARCGPVGHQPAQAVEPVDAGASRTLVLERPWPGRRCSNRWRTSSSTRSSASATDRARRGLRPGRAERGIDARRQNASAVAERRGRPALDRIRKLLALAGSSNQHRPSWRCAGRTS